MAILGWGLLFGVLVVQLVFTVLFLLPLPYVIRKYMIQIVHSIRHVLLVVGTLSAMLAYQSYLGFSRDYADERIKHGTQTMDLMLLNVTKQVRSQRNFYLSILCLTLSFVLVRLASILKRNLELQDEIRVLKQIHGNVTKPTTTTTTTVTPTPSAKKTN
jgi:hypothetical protein